MTLGLPLVEQGVVLYAFFSFFFFVLADDESSEVRTTAKEDAIAKYEAEVQRKAKPFLKEYAVERAGEATGWDNLWSNTNGEVEVLQSLSQASGSRQERFGTGKYKPHGRLVT